MVCTLPKESALSLPAAVAGYLVKPVSPQSLLDTLRQFGDTVDKILIVDDDQDFVRLLSRILDNPVRHYQTSSARNGQEGLAMLRYRQPDLVLVDLALPDMSSTAFIELVRQDPAGQIIPIIALMNPDEGQPRAALAGPITLTKPQGFLPGEVVQWAQAMVEAANWPSEPASDEERPGASPS
jgi:CheY-like chemotaxis protein